MRPGGFIYKIMLMPPAQQNQYEFIMNPSRPPKRRFDFHNNLKARIAVVAVLLILVVIVATVVSSFLNKDAQAQAQRLTEVAQAQSEIIRVSALAKDKAKKEDTRNFALNAKLSVESSQQEIRKVLSKRGVSEKSLNKQLSAGKNSKTDAALDEAAKNNRFDETFTAILNQQLKDYQKLLQGAFASGNSDEKKAITYSYENAARLVGKPAEGQAAAGV